MKNTTELHRHGLAKAGPCLFVFLLLLALTGCEQTQQSPTNSTDDLPSSPEQRKEQAIDAVESFYDAAARGDCKRVMELVPKFKTVDECEHFSERFAGNGLRFLGPKEVRIDGRDPRAVIIKAETMRRGEKDDMNLRAEFRHNRWIIVF
ncbi:MAG: hypothetical protein ACQEVA_02740 [Myxococcota bacterium]